MPLQRSVLRGIVITSAIFILGLVGTAVIDVMGWDLTWISSFYVPGGANDGWVHAREFPWNVLYDYGEHPGVFLLVAAIAYGIAAWVGEIPRRYARPCMAIVLAIALGPGLLVNGILKPYWGRPRPAEITNFGGNEEFRPVWKPGGPGEGRSFTCGHCAMAFSLASGVAFYPLYPTISICAVVGGVAYGTIMGAARMAQGGHFPTDVLWSGALVLMLITLLYYVVLKIPENEAEPPRPEK